MEEPDQNLAHITWSFPEAVAANPARSLATPDLAMDYFAYSPFFNQQSNNAVLRTQRRIENPAYGHAEEKIELLAFRTGFEYIVAHSRPPDLFVIHRRAVLPDGGRGPVTHAYFILQEKIYMAPNLYEALSVRLRNAALVLEDTFDKLEKAHPPANPRATSVWISAGQERKKLEEGRARAKASGKEPEKDKEGEKEKEGEKKEEKEEKSASAPAAPDASWALAFALQATEAALPELNKLSSAPAPALDTAAEQKALETLAKASIRPGGAVASTPRALSPISTVVPAPAVPTSVGTPSARRGSLLDIPVLPPSRRGSVKLDPAGTLPLPGAPVMLPSALTPGALAAFTPRQRMGSLSRPVSNLSGESPRLL